MSDAEFDSGDREDREREREETRKRLDTKMYLHTQNYSLPEIINFLEITSNREIIIPVGSSKRLIMRLQELVKSRDVVQRVQEAIAPAIR